MKRGRLSGVSVSSDGSASVDELYRGLIGNDDNSLPLPPVGRDPHLLTSRVRKYYFNSVIKLLCVNYEQHQKLMGKNLRKPSAIWRCAKFIELQAVQASMLMQLYRENILVVIKKLKADTEKGKIYRNLLECLLNPPNNDKQVQVNLDVRDPLNGPSKKRKRSLAEPYDTNIKTVPLPNKIETPVSNNHHFQIPVVVNTQSDVPMSLGPQPVTNPLPPPLSSVLPLQNTFDLLQNPVTAPNSVQLVSKASVPLPSPVQSLLNELSNVSQDDTGMSHSDTFSIQKPGPSQTHPDLNRLSIESLDAEDQVMLQMEELFKTDDNDDDLFERTLCNDFDIFTSHNGSHVHDNSKSVVPQATTVVAPAVTPIEDIAPAASLDERIALLNSTGALAPEPPDKDSPKPRKPLVSKWKCELYFQRQKLSETLDLILETNRKKYERIKLKFLELFGEDDDDELMMSPLDETPDFVTSCIERIAPTVVKFLMRYYDKKRIKTKASFKKVAKQIIDSIIEVNRFPDDREVFTFITDYFKTPYLH